MLLRLVDLNNPMRYKKNPDSLQDLCYHTISGNVDQYKPEEFEDLATPCLKVLAPKLPLNNVFILEDLLKRRGINVVAVYKAFLDKVITPPNLCFFRGTTSPHLMNRVTEQTWDRILGTFLSRVVFSPVFHEHDLMLQRNGSSSLDEYLKDIVTRYPDLKQLFVPDHMHELVSWDQPLRAHGHIHPQSNTHESMMDFVERVSLKISSCRIDSQFCSFFSDRRNAKIFDALCASVCDIHLFLNGGDIMQDVVSNLITNSSLSVVSLHCLRIMDMKYFDFVMSKCSGVVGFYETDIGREESTHFNARYFCRDGDNGDCPQQCDNNDRPDTGDSQKTVGDEHPSQGTELDDVAGCRVLSGVAKIASGLNHCQISNMNVTCSTVSSFSFDASRLVPRELYKNVLTHHFVHWQSLVRLHFAPPKIDQELALAISVLIKRPTFKILSLADCVISCSVLGEILTCVAENRKETPLDELIFVNLLNPSRTMEDANGAEVNDDFIGHDKACPSSILRSIRSFKGTKTLEVSGRQVDTSTGHLLYEFTTRDCALKQLYIANSLDRQLVKSIMLTLARNAQPLTHINLENCGLLEGDISVFATFLASQAKTLESISVKGSFCVKDFDGAEAIANALSQCEKIHTLSLEKINLGPFARPLVKDILTPTLKNLRLANNRVGVRDTFGIIKDIGSRATPNDPTLNVLDVTLDGFRTVHLAQCKPAAKRAARIILCDEGTPVGFLNALSPCFFEKSLGCYF